MANLNQKNTIEREVARTPNATTNYAGGRAYEMSPKLKLYSMVSTWFVNEPKFYNDSDETRITNNNDREIFATIDEVLKTDPDFVLKLAIYARNTLNLRTAPSVLLAEASLARRGEPKPKLKKSVCKIIRRADELAGIVAYIQSKIGNIGDGSPEYSLPASLKKGLAYTCRNFSPYQLSKYNNMRRHTKLADVFKLTHAKPTNAEQGNLWRKVIRNELEPADTWENIISNKGSNTETWNEALEVMPYMATLRNGRNILQHGADVEKFAKRIANKPAVLASKQMPFRYYAAYREIMNIQSFEAQTMLSALEQAMEYSVENIPDLKGNTIIGIDSSGSMSGAVSAKSTMRRYEIANLLGAIAHRVCENSMVYLFDDRVRHIQGLDQAGSILQKTQSLSGQYTGGATYGHLLIDNMIERNIKADRLIIFSDFQCYNDSYQGYRHVDIDKSVHGSLVEYRRKVNPDISCYSIDMCGYGTLQIPEGDNKTCLISGWNDKILGYINMFEKSGKDVVEEIEAICL